MKLSKEAIIGIVANILAIIAIAISAYFWVSKQVENRVDKEVEPYKNLLEATSLLQNENFDYAVNKFDAAYTKLKDEDLSDESLAALISPYLEAIALSYDPEIYKHKFKDIEKKILYELPPTENNMRNLGWTYLSINELDKAIESFEKSIELSLMRDKLYDVSWAYTGLFYCSIAKGECKKAMEYFVEGATYDSEFFEKKRWLNEYKLSKEDYFINSLVLKYEPFIKTYDEFFRALSKK